MNIEEIRNNAPEGATHYRFSQGEVEYLKKISYHDTWYMWLNPVGKWITTLWTKVKIGDEIKTL